MKTSLNKPVQHIRYLLLFYILLVSSIYMGLLMSLHLFWYPGWEMISLSGMDANFNRPVQLAVRTFKPLVVLLNLSALLLILFQDAGKFRLLYALLLTLICLFTWVSVQFIMPLNEILGKPADEGMIRRNLLLWMKYNDYRTGIIILAWLVTVFLLTKHH